LTPHKHSHKKFIWKKVEEISTTQKLKKQDTTFAKTVGSVGIVSLVITERARKEEVTPH